MKGIVALPVLRTLNDPPLFVTRCPYCGMVNDGFGSDAECPYCYVQLPMIRTLRTEDQAK